MRITVTLPSVSSPLTRISYRPPRNHSARLSSSLRATTSAMSHPPCAAVLCTPFGTDRVRRSLPRTDQRTSTSDAVAVNKRGIIESLDRRDLVVELPVYVVMRENLRQIVHFLDCDSA